MHMAAYTYANEMLMRLNRFFDENLSFIFVKLRSRFSFALRKSFLAKIIIYSDNLYIITIYWVSRMDLIHMLGD